MQRNKGQFTSSKPIHEDSSLAIASWEPNESWSSDGNGSQQQEILLVSIYDFRFGYYLKNHAYYLIDPFTLLIYWPVAADIVVLVRSQHQ